MNTEPMGNQLYADSSSVIDDLTHYVHHYNLR